MKKLSKIRLTQISKADLEARQMNALKGGKACRCSCGGCTSSTSLTSSDAYNCSTNGMDDSY